MDVGAEYSFCILLVVFMPDIIQVYATFVSISNISQKSNLVFKDLWSRYFCCSQRTIVHFVTLLFFFFFFEAFFAPTPGIAVSHQVKASGTGYVIVHELNENRIRNIIKMAPCVRVSCDEFPCVHVCALPYNWGVCVCVNYSYYSNEPIEDIPVVSRILPTIG